MMKKIGKKMSDSIFCYVWTSTYGGRLALTQDEWIMLDELILHRLDGPAVTFVTNGATQWWQNGRPHRLDGPAFEWKDGEREWAIDGNGVPGDENEKWIKENEVDLSTEENQMALKLMWI